jgi:hypothetical protein
MTRKSLWKMKSEDETEPPISKFEEALHIDRPLIADLLEVFQKHNTAPHDALVHSLMLTGFIISQSDGEESRQTLYKSSIQILEFVATGKEPKVENEKPVGH